MRVLIVITRADTIGGGQQHVIDLAGGLQAAGHDVLVAHGPGSVIAERIEVPPSRQFEIESLRPEIGKLRSDVEAYKALSSLVDRLSPDLLALHSTKAGVLGRLVGGRHGVPAVYTLHGVSFTKGVKFHRRVLGVLTELAMRPLTTHAIAVSENDQDLALRLRTLSPERIDVVYNAVVDVSERSHAAGSDPVRLVSVARIDDQKNHDDLLLALSRIPKDLWELELVGDGPNEHRIEALSAELGIADSVKMVGRANDVADRLASAQIFVLSTHYEGLPISIIEAMRAGLPIVATDVGGVSELVVNGENGLLVAPRSVDSLAIALEALIGDSDQRVKLGEESRRRFESGFDLDSFVSQTLGVYERVLASAVSA